MTAVPPRERTASGRGFQVAVIAWFQFAGAWALAIAWPVYQNIASGPEALTGFGLRRLDLAVLVILVSLLVPTIVVLLEGVVWRLSGERVRAAFHAAMVAAVVAVFVWQQLIDSAAIVRIGLPVAAGLVFVLLLRSEFGRNFFLVLGIAVPAVIVMFCLSYPVWAEIGGHEKAVAPEKLEATTPVVIVIFDELPLASLEDEHGRIDGGMFPAFGELASGSTWYPDMLAVADQTTFAVPSILTGSDPAIGFTTEPPSPGLPDFPDGVCPVARNGGYSIHAYEPITDLCGRTFGLGSRVTAALRRGTGASDDVIVDKLDPLNAVATGSDAIALPFKQPWTEYGPERDQAVDWFVNGMPDEERSLSVLHIALPHIDWDYLPDGTRYVSNRFGPSGSLTSPPTRGEVNRDMQMMMLQLAYTDRRLAGIIERMKADGIWGKSLFVVTADHGAAFLPGGSRRIAGRKNAGWIMPVPLFIKYPSQTGDKEVRGDATSVDIAPTVLDQLGAELPPEVDGKSLTGKRRLPHQARYEFHSALGQFEMSRTRIDRLLRQARRQRNTLFGSGSFYAIGGRPDLIGTEPEKADDLHPLEYTDDSPASFNGVDLDSPERPSYFQAILTANDRPASGKVAVALNGKVVATSTTWTDAATGQNMTGVDLPPGAFAAGDNAVRLYGVR